MFAPDYSSSDEDGLSDDNDYYEFKQRLKNKQREKRQVEANSETEQIKIRLKQVFSAISYGQNELVLNELNKGLDVNVDLEYGWTPLLLTATVANETLIPELLKRGANINQTRETLTPLMITCNISTDDESLKNKILQCVKILIANDAEVNTVDRKRRNAVMLAANNGHLDVVKFLLPLTTKEAEDNQRWTALFWAVEGNKVEVVDYLLNEGFDCEKTDLRGHTVTDIAHSNGFEDILNLLPCDSGDNDVYIEYLNNQVNFEETFTNLKKDEKPDLFVDVVKILYGTGSEDLVPIFSEKRISLLDFLSLTDTKLKDLGVEMPYQRKRIMGGLFRFHKHPFQPKSIPCGKKGELFTNVDVSSTVLSGIRQCIAMEASLNFILGHHENKLNPEESKEVQMVIAKNRKQIKRLKTLTQQFLTKAEKWDSALKPADKITKKRLNIPWCNLLALGVLSSLVMIYFKIK